MPKQKITKRKDGRFSAMVNIGHDPQTGKLKRKTVYGKTKSEVRAKIRELETQVAKGEISPKTRNDITVGQWADEWLDTFVVNKKANTIRSYSSIINAHIKPDLGAVKLGNLTTLDCQRFINKLQKNNTPKTARYCGVILKNLLGKAVLLEYLPKNPMDGIIYQKKQQPQIHPLDEDEVMAFLKEAESTSYVSLFKFLLFTGVRIGEALALDWDSVGDNSIIISKQFPTTLSDKKSSTPKNGKSREIPINSYVNDTLKEIKISQTENRLALGKAYSNKLNLVFTDESGTKLSYAPIYHSFKKTADSIGCPDTRIHDLRHTYAILNLKAGVDPKTLSESLGHASVSFTLDKYAYVTDKMREDSGKKLDSILNDIGL